MILNNRGDMLGQGAKGLNITKSTSIYTIDVCNPSLPDLI